MATDLKTNKYYLQTLSIRAGLHKVISYLELQENESCVPWNHFRKQGSCCIDNHHDIIEKNQCGTQKQKLLWSFALQF
jgi:hypothetical protein